MKLTTKMDIRLELENIEASVFNAVLLLATMPENHEEANLIRQQGNEIIARLVVLMGLCNEK
jgi:hypothetical protein